jgi:hypothetical protein
MFGCRENHQIKIEIDYNKTDAAKYINRMKETIEWKNRSNKLDGRIDGDEEN